MFDSPRFARTYVITFWMWWFGIAGFGSGIILLAAFGTAVGAALLLLGLFAMGAGTVWVAMSAYRELRALGHNRYYAVSRSGPYSVPSVRWYRDYRAALRSRDEGPSSSNSSQS